MARRMASRRLSPAVGSRNDGKESEDGTVECAEQNGEARPFDQTSADQLRSDEQQSVQQSEAGSGDQCCIVEYVEEQGVYQRVEKDAERNQSDESGCVDGPEEKHGSARPGGAGQWRDNSAHGEECGESSPDQEQP